MQSHSVLSTTGDTKILPELAKRLHKTSISVIKEMMFLGEQEKAKGKDSISLGVGIPFYAAPKHIHDHAIKALETKPDIDKYTFFTGIAHLRELIATQASRELDIPVTADEVLVTSGSMGALLYSMLTLLNPGDEVILPSPYFSSHGEQVSIAQGNVVAVPMIEDEKEGFRLPVEGIKKAITAKTKAIVINSPQNPTGTVYTKEDLLALADILKNEHIYIITDEVYDYLLYDNTQYFNIATVKSLWPQIIRCWSFSKKYGMMGWRVGYLHTHKDLMMHILKIHDSNIVCAAHVSQEAAIAALSGPQDVVNHHHTLLLDNRELMCKRLDVLSDLFTYMKPRGTYYAFPKFSIPIPSIEMAKRLLYEAGVVTVPGVGFGKEGEQHLRLSFGATPEDINKAFDRIEAWWKKNKKTQ